VRQPSTMGLTGAILAFAVLVAGTAHADPGWVAVAKSPSKESLDWVAGPGRTQQDAETQALQNCALIQRDNCSLVASGPNCAAVAWDGAQPLNHAYGAIGDTPASALNAAVAAAGPFANGPEVRCSYTSYSPGAH
jgi:hypothetical protein